LFGLLAMAWFASPAMAQDPYPPGPPSGTEVDLGGEDEVQERVNGGTANAGTEFSEANIMLVSVFVMLALALWGFMYFVIF
jgi:hypothetical protein